MPPLADWQQQRLDPLTARVQQVFHYLRDYQAEFDNLPTSRQVARHFGWHSQTAAYSYFVRLTEAKLIEPISHSQSNTIYRFQRA